MTNPKPPGYWTPERVKEKVNKHKTLKDFFTKDFDAYSAASRLKILKEVTKNLSREQLPAGHWTKKTIKEAIKDFKSFKEWYEEDLKSYAAAQRLKLLDDENVVGHLIRVEGRPISKWTKKTALEDALLDDSRSAWKLRSPSAYRASRERGYFDEAVAHMTLMGNKFKRCIYIIEIKNKKKVYVGLTQHFETRIKAHLKSKRFKNFKKEQLIIRQASEYIAREKAAQLEIDLMEKKLDEGFKLLNEAPGGGLGGSTLEWTKEKVSISAKKEKLKMIWKKKYPGAYAAALRGGYLEEVTIHMPILNPKGKWKEKEDVLADANKYPSRSEWQFASVGAYESAKLYGWFEEAVAHMPKRAPNKNIKWNKEAVIKDAKKYKFRKDWHTNSSGAYEAAKKNGWFKEAVAHMLNKKAIPTKWTKKKVLANAKKYKKKSVWKKNSPGAHGAARKGGYYKEATSHMK